MDTNTRIVTQDTKGRKPDDVDTPLTNTFDDMDTDLSGMAEEVLNIWLKSTDKKSIEILFETLLGYRFSAFVEKSTETMSPEERAVFISET